jgi:hypothetical protein
LFTENRWPGRRVLGTGAMPATRGCDQIADRMSMVAARYSLKRRLEK